MSDTPPRSNGLERTKQRFELDYLKREVRRHGESIDKLSDAQTEHSNEIQLARVEVSGMRHQLTPMRTDIERLIKTVDRSIDKQDERMCRTEDRIGVWQEDNNRRFGAIEGQIGDLEEDTGSLSKEALMIRYKNECGVRDEEIKRLVAVVEDHNRERDLRQSKVKSSWKIWAAIIGLLAAVGTAVVGSVASSMASNQPTKGIKK